MYWFFFLFYHLCLSFSLQLLCFVGDVVSIVLLLSGFFTSRIVSDCHFFIVSISIFRSWTVLFICYTCFILFPCIPLRDLFDSFLKASYHLYQIGFKVISLCFSCVRISKTCYNRLAVLWRCHIALAFVDQVLLRAFSHMGGFGPWMF